jgi:glutamate-1-semialdehyde 2,1-aminomutase
LIFDETITGFRFANGGAQEYFKITPDLATFGKGLANGYPVSAIVGRRDIMKFMEDIFFSFTFGGETLSLSASAATLDKLRRDDVCKHIASQGRKIIDGVNELILRHSVSDFISISGHPSWSFLILRDFSGYSQFKIKTLLLQELFSRGILSLGSHNLSFAHSDLDIAYLLKVYDEVFPILKTAVIDRHMDKLLLCEPLEPLFKVR